MILLDFALLTRSLLRHTGDGYDERYAINQKCGEDEKIVCQTV